MKIIHIEINQPACLRHVGEVVAFYFLLVCGDAYRVLYILQKIKKFLILAIPTGSDGDYF